MRADRLLSILLLLQTHGQSTCRRLAAELEVSERTIYRDITALSTAGIPVYTEKGANGGVRLLEDYRTNLTGMSIEEVRALTLLNIPQPLVELGMDRALKGALLKLSAAISPTVQEAQEHTRQRIHLDSNLWFQTDEPLPHLGVIQQAVWQDRLLDILISDAFDTEIELRVAPYGLVAKANIWHLVAEKEGHFRVLRVSQIRQAQICQQIFTRCASFNLAAFWARWCADYESLQPHYSVRVRISPELVGFLQKKYGSNLLTFENPPSGADETGWQSASLTFDNFYSARTQLLGLGGAIEVLEPLALRLSLIDFAEQALSVYRKNGQSS